MIYKVWLLILKASHFGCVVLCSATIPCTISWFCANSHSSSASDLHACLSFNTESALLLSRAFSVAAAPHLPHIFSSPCFGQWVNVSLINHFIPCQSFGLTERYRRDRHCFKKWCSAHDAAGNMNEMKCYRNEYHIKQPGGKVQERFSFMRVLQFIKMYLCLKCSWLHLL